MLLYSSTNCPQGKLQAACWGHTQLVAKLWSPQPWPPHSQPLPSPGRGENPKKEAPDGHSPSDATFFGIPFYRRMRAAKKCECTRLVGRIASRGQVCSGGRRLPLPLPSKGRGKGKIRKKMLGRALCHATSGYAPAIKRQRVIPPLLNDSALCPRGRSGLKWQFSSIQEAPYATCHSLNPARRDRPTTSSG